MKSFLQAAMFTLCLMLSVSGAQAVMMTGSFTGAWFDESAPGQGFLIQVVDVEDIPTAVVYWFTFDTAGNQLWLVGQSAVQGEAVTMDMNVVTGGILSAGAFDPNNVTLESWGDLTLSFTSCDNGDAVFTAADPGIGMGGFAITRLTQTLGDECSGGISDNHPSGSGAENLRVDFVPASAAPSRAGGFVKFEQNANHTKLKVHLKKLTPGQYILRVDGQDVGEISTNNGGNGKLFFRSPGTCNWELLDFEPRNVTIEVVQDDQVFLSTVLEAGDLDSNPDTDNDDDPDDNTACGI